MDRFDICEAHAVLEWDYNVSGMLQERPTNQRKMESTGVQLHRMSFKARSNLTFETLSDDGKYVYAMNVLQWKLPAEGEVKAYILENIDQEKISYSSHRS